MRALFDANVFISYLLPSAHASAITGIVEAAIQGEFVLLTTPDLLRELALRVAAKPYLASRIDPEDVAQLVEIILDAGEAVPPIEEPIPAVCRDPKDDYLLAHAVVGRADYLVSGDRDLLVLDERAGLRIVTPARFAAILSGEGS